MGDDFWVTLSMAPALHADGSPIHSIYWQPSKPKRMSPERYRLFDQGKRQAVAEIAAASTTSLK